MVTDQDLAREKRRDPQMGRKKSMSVFYGEGCRYRDAEDFYVFWQPQLVKVIAHDFFLLDVNQSSLESIDSIIDTLRAGPETRLSHVLAK